MRRTLLFAIAVVAACGNPTFVPPAEPPHTKEEDGYLHVPRFEQPFRCGVAGDLTGKLTVSCKDLRERPPDHELSCDALGCHGDYEFDGNRNFELNGSEGPSCHTCHGVEWNLNQ